MANGGVARLLKVFAVEHPVDILLDCTSGAFYAWMLGDKKLCSRCISSNFKDFYSTCNFDIIRLNDEILPENEQNLKFFKQITEHF